TYQPLNERVVMSEAATVPGPRIPSKYGFDLLVLLPRDVSLVMPLDDDYLVGVGSTEPTVASRSTRLGQVDDSLTIVVVRRVVRVSHYTVYPADFELAKFCSTAWPAHWNLKFEFTKANHCSIEGPLLKKHTKNGRDRRAHPQVTREHPLSLRIL